jgi:predicted MFS family arabinose efflux permease
MAKPTLWTRPFALGFVANFAHSLAFHGYVHLGGRLEQLGADELEIGIVVATMAAAAIAARPAVGRVLDTHGRRLVLLVGSVAHVVATLGYLAIDDLGPLLYVLRILHGLADAMLFSVLFTIAADVVPRARRTEGIAMFGISGMIPLSLAGWLGDAVLVHGDYDVLFSITAGAAICGTIAGWWLPDSRPDPEDGDAPARSYFRAIADRRLRPLWMIGFCFALAVASYFTFPILSSLVVARAPPSERGTALASFTALFDLGLLVGGPLLGLVLELSDYATMFTVAGLVAAGGAVLFAFWDRS